MSNLSNLDRLFYWRGISDSFFSYKGQHTAVPLENRLKLLNAMGVDTSSDASIDEEVFNLDIKPWLSWVPPLATCPAADSYVDISLKPNELNSEIDWCLSAEGKDVKSGSISTLSLEEIGDYFHKGERFSRRRIVFGELEPNYYELSLTDNKRFEACQLAASPKTAYLPDWADKELKLWGFVVQLYTLRSESNWGIGDYSDLRKLIESSVHFGVDILGLNPFHTLQSDIEHNFSPYSPSDRRFLNPLYIDVERAPGYDHEFRPSRKIEELRDRIHVDYLALKEIKYEALYSCYENFLLGDTSVFIEYLEDSNEELIRFVNYELINTWRSRDGVGLSIGRSAILSCLKDESGVLPVEMREGTFHCYLQWVAEAQLEDCQTFAISEGMKVGLLRDLAVGANGGGAEVKTNPELFCDDASIGAPPDPLALTGQNWGVPPMDPAEMRRDGFSHVRNLIHSNMKSSGALRIDHAMSLYRLWWCPPGETADKGSYVYYPFEELMGILCIESYLNKTAVVAEDLGIVPDEFRNAMTEKGLYGNKVFYFEKWQDTEFKSPSDYEPHALAMLNNHDVPTMTSWWNETDLVLRNELSLLEPGVSLSEVISHRREEKRDVLARIRSAGLLVSTWNENDVERNIDWPLMCCILNYTAQCESRLFLVQLEDLLMMNEPVNVPGTYLEHKNWSRKLTRNLEDIFGDDSICESLKNMNRIRKS